MDSFQYRKYKSVNFIGQIKNAFDILKKLELRYSKKLLVKGYDPEASESKGFIEIPEWISGKYVYMSYPSKHGDNSNLTAIDLANEKGIYLKI